MNYIKVSDVATTVEKAKELAAIIEIADEEYYNGRMV
jgi:hypothetical protein